jgi:hypothetical protein
MLRSILALTALTLTVSAHAATATPGFYEIEKLNAAVFSMDHATDHKTLKVGISTGGCGVNNSDFKFELELINIKDVTNAAQTQVGQKEFVATVKVNVLKKSGSLGAICAMAIDTVQTVDITNLVKEKAPALGLISKDNTYYSVELTTAPVVAYEAVR